MSIKPIDLIHDEGAGEAVREIERYLPRRGALLKACRKLAARIKGFHLESFGEARAVARLASAELDDAVYPGVSEAFQLDAELLAAALELVRLYDRALELDAHVAECAAAERTRLRAAAAPHILAEGDGAGGDEPSPDAEADAGLRYRS